MFRPENINWLGVANKYIENQWELKKKWGDYEMSEKDSFDKSFISEFNFVVDEIK